MHDADLHVLNKCRTVFVCQLSDCTYQITALTQNSKYKITEKTMSKVVQFLFYVLFKESLFLSTNCVES